MRQPLTPAKLAARADCADRRLAAQPRKRNIRDRASRSLSAFGELRFFRRNGLIPRRCAFCDLRTFRRNGLIPRRCAFCGLRLFRRNGLIPSLSRDAHGAQDYARFIEGAFRSGEAPGALIRILRRPDPRRKPKTDRAGPRTKRREKRLRRARIFGRGPPL